MDTIQRENLRQIDALNQRGGRMLSLVDLIDAGTLPVRLAGELAACALLGGSFVTAAGPGGVGKTTLMGAMLGFVPPDCELVTISSPSVLDEIAARDPAHPECLVVHEIGAGSWFGYLWGEPVARFFRLGARSRRSLATNLHADTFDEAREQLTAAPLGVSDDALAAVDCFAFMVARGGRRRVSSVHYGGADHAPAWRWDARGDAFRPTGVDAAEALARSRDLPPGEVRHTVDVLADALRRERETSRRRIGEVRAAAIQRVRR
jgi:energy-coupling factor transporter ATP-binding protein EcfA2